MQAFNLAVCSPCLHACRLPASNNPEVFKAQQTMFEAWSIVGECHSGGWTTLMVSPARFHVPCLDWFAA